MPDRTIRCEYNKICSKAGTSSCYICKNNSFRNKPINCFEEAHDNPKLTYSGMADCQRKSLVRLWI